MANSTSNLYKGVIALLVAVLVLLPLSASAQMKQTRAEEWRAIAVSALDEFKQRDDGALRVNSYAWALEAEWRLNGFDSQYGQTLLAKVLSMKNPDGGYGLPFAYDKFNDGTVNPETTTYTVTLAGHVGPVLLLGYEHGVVPHDEVWTIVNLLVRYTPHIDTAAGMCLAYSRSSNDSKPGMCTHNVNAGAAAFLLDANAHGVGRSGLAALVEGILRREVSAYTIGPVSPEGYIDWWRYSDAEGWQDPDHNSYTVESMFSLAPQIGQNAGVNMMIKPWPLITAGLIHSRLAALPVIPGFSNWCVLGDQWIPEVQQFVIDTNNLDNLNAANRQAQIAQAAARVSDNCPD